MFDDTSKDIYRQLNFMPITLLSDKLRVLIIGGGKAALIKSKAFLNKGCIVEAIAINFIPEFYIIKNIKLKEASYSKEFILNKHVVVIAIDDTVVIKEIIYDCEYMSKIYINSTNYKEGIGIIPISRETQNISIAVNTKLGNPKASVMIAEHLVSEINTFDSFIRFTSLIRNRLKVDKSIKREVLSFINTIDFKYFYDRNKHFEVLTLFWEEQIVKDIRLLMLERELWN